MDFKKYNSIENSYRTKFLNKIVEEGHSNKIFVVQEKIHGANFSLWMDEVKIVCGKRSGFLDDKVSFNGSQGVVKKYYGNLRNLFTFLQTDRNAKEVAVFCEIYGGGYPHPEVARDKHATRVQGEVQYCPDNRIIGFDISVDGILQDVDETNYLLDKFNLPKAETLFRGSLEECLKYPNEFTTTIPKLLGLPEIDGNTCEGVVIRPIENTYLWSGERLILKNKNAKFSEKDKEPKRLKDTPKDLTEEAKSVLEIALTYLNDNRLRNVLSKLGPVTQSDFGKIMGNLMHDLMEDFLKDYGDILEALDKDSRKQLGKQIGQHSALLVRKNFANILDNQF